MFNTKTDHWPANHEISMFNAGQEMNERKKRREMSPTSIKDQVK